MAKKATKTLAASNAAALSTLHKSSAAINSLFILYRFIYHRRTTTFNSIILYLILSAPAFIIQFYFEKLSRPRYAGNGRGGGPGDVLRAGEDLAAKGLMEYMWDCVYVTWGCLLVVMVAGERGWWLWAAIPVYAAYLALGMYKKMRGGMGGLIPGAGDAAEMDMDELDAATGDGSGMSKRQQKLEKRGGQKVRYR
ncbi:hypothetical protein BJ508DRAFT_244816 [Ascobolus immersus RN42]|uniref:DUF788-domain-containing protein n=1 Tax=Ascobolus immersus RN42 TaxID=1160509 RepID=A0A3N4HI74_ASCIM|nr:hypothetical protein BJ508DRAFT_244816 [Ascobolus immersus RN42]